MRETKRDTSRFAALALRLEPKHHPAYAAAILRGLGESRAEADASAVLKAARHLGSLGDANIDRWLAWSVRYYLKDPLPDDPIDLLVDRMLNSPDPGPYDWGREGEDSDPERDGLLMRGINCVRGHTAELLGDYLVYDVDGSCTARIIPSLPGLATEE